MRKVYFPYFANETLAFSEHYNELVVFSTPLSFMTEELLKNMEAYGKPTFRVPARYSKTGADIWFIFNIIERDGDYFYYYDKAKSGNLVRKYEPDIDYRKKG